MGKRHVHTLLTRTPRAQVVAVCTNLSHELDWARNNEEYKEFGIEVYENYDDMLNHPGLQVSGDWHNEISANAEQALI